MECTRLGTLCGQIRRRQECLRGQWRPPATPAPSLGTSETDLASDRPPDHTMFRIKDPKISLDFYTRILGMELGESSRIGRPLQAEFAG